MSEAEEGSKGIESIGNEDEAVSFEANSVKNEPVHSELPKKESSRTPLFIAVAALAVFALGGYGYLHWQNSGQSKFTATQNQPVKVQPLPNNARLPVSTAMNSGSIIAPEQPVNGFVTGNAENDLDSVRKVAGIASEALVIKHVVSEPEIAKVDPALAQEMRKTQAEISAMKFVVADVQTMIVGLSNRFDTMQKSIDVNAKRTALNSRNIVHYKNSLRKKERTVKTSKRIVKKTVYHKKMPPYIIDGIVDGRAWIHRKASRKVFAVSEGEILDKKYGLIKSINSNGKITTDQGLVNVVKG